MRFAIPHPNINLGQNTGRVMVGIFIINTKWLYIAPGISGTIFWGFKMHLFTKYTGDAEVTQVNLVNRGIPYLQVSLAWKNGENGETPGSVPGAEGVRPILSEKYYVEFDRHYKQGDPLRLWLMGSQEMAKAR
jgi:hypothetical protein